MTHCTYITTNTQDAYVWYNRKKLQFIT